MCSKSIIFDPLDHAYPMLKVYTMYMYITHCTAHISNCCAYSVFYRFLCETARGLIIGNIPGILTNYMD